MMKFIKLSFISVICLLAIAACNTEVATCIDPVTGEICEAPPVPVYPTLTKIDSVGFLVDDIFVDPSETIHILLKGIQGDSLLTTLEIRENGLLLDLSRLTIDSTQNSIDDSFQFPSNPYRFTRNDPDRFTWDLGLTVQDTKDKVQYEFILADESQRIAITDIIVNTLINETTPPRIDLISNPTAPTLGQGAVSFEFNVNAIGSPIESIAVYQASSIVAESRLQFDGVPFDTNPLILTDPDRDGFNKEIQITSTEAFTLQGYTVIFLDSLGVDYNYELAIQVIEPIEGLDGLLLRSAQTGSSSVGAFNLQDVAETGDEDPNAHIKDSGDNIDGTWKQKITAFNGSEMAKVIVDVALLQTEDDIKNIWDQLEDVDKLVLSSDSGEPEEYTSEKVNRGDIFIVKNFNSYYVIIISEVNDTDGAESYTFSLRS